MNLKELSFPIRIYWDLTPLPDNPTVNYSRIAGQIVEMKFFTLNLLDTGHQLSTPCIEILEQLKNENISVALTASHDTLNPSAINDLKVRELLVDVSSKADLPLIVDSMKKNKDRKMTIGVSFQVIEDNYSSIPDIVSYCLNNEIARIVFPMQRLTTKSSCFYISRKDGEVLTRKLNKFDIKDMNITIHDPFLWRIFYPAVSFPGGGCQAANSMAYISPDGKVYPCPSMPIELGDLNKTPLRTILSSVYKKELVKSLQEPPEKCLGCEEISGCMGGCTGRVFVLSGSLAERDPAC